MSDDIVTQLRWISDAKEWVKLRDWTIITAEAADEIERLREELKLVKRQRDAWHADAVGLDYEDVAGE